MKKATKRIIARIMAVMMVVSILPFDMWGTANVAMAEELSVTDVESPASVEEDVAVEGDAVSTGDEGQEPALTDDIEDSEATEISESTENSGDVENGEDISLPEEPEKTEGGEEVSAPEEDAEIEADVENSEEGGALASTSLDVGEADVLYDVDETTGCTIIENQQELQFTSTNGNDYFKLATASLNSSAWNGTYKVKEGSLKDTEIVTSGKGLKTSNGTTITFVAKTPFEILLVYGAKNTNQVDMKVNDTVTTKTTNAESSPAEPIEYVGNFEAGTYTVQRNTSKEGVLYYIAVIPAAIKVATPTITPDIAAGDITKTEKVTLSCTTDGAVIYYTTDGTDPDVTKSEQQYTSGTEIEIDGQETGVKTLKAIAVVKDESGAVKGTSEMFSRTYTYSDPNANAIAPTAKIDPVANEDNLVELNSKITLETTTVAGENEEVKILYTTDGSEPDAEGVTPEEYDSETGIVITEGEDGIIGTDNKVTIKAYTTCTNKNPSGVQTFEYTVQALEAIGCATKAGAYKRGQEIVLTNSVSAEEGTEIYYTDDGTTPSKTNGTKFGDKIVLKEDTTIKAIAVNSKYVSSEILTLAYTIKPSVPTRAGVVHNFTEHWKNSNYFNIADTAEVIDEETPITYDGKNLTGYVELGTDTVKFEAANAGTLTLVTTASSVVSVKADEADAVEETADESGVVTVPLVADTQYAISKGSSDNKLYYMAAEFEFDSSKYGLYNTKTWLFNADNLKNKYGLVSSLTASGTQVAKDADIDGITVIEGGSKVQAKPKEDSLSVADGGKITLPIQADTKAVEVTVKLGSGGSDVARAIIIGEGDTAETVYQVASAGSPAFKAGSLEYTNTHYYLTSEEGFFRDNNTALLITGVGGENKIASITLNEYKDKLDIPIELHKPVISSENGATSLNVKNATISLELTDEDKEIEDVKILYTTDGSDPKATDNTNVKMYTAPISVAELVASDSSLTSITIKAYTVKEGTRPSYTSSDVVTATYTLYDPDAKMGAPIISVTPEASGDDNIIARNASISIDFDGEVGDDDDFSIYYTTEPDQELTSNTELSNLEGTSIKEYKTAFDITDDMIKADNKVTVKAIAVDNAANGKETSNLSTKVYTVQALSDLEVTSPKETTVARGEKVVLNYKGTEEGVSIYYTVGENTTPTAGSSEYPEGGIPIKNDGVIKAIAIKDGYISSAILTLNYTIKGSTSNDAGAVHNFTTDGTKSNYFTFASGLSVADVTDAVNYKGLNLTGYVLLGTDTVKFTTGDKAAKLTLVADNMLSVQAGSGAAEPYTPDTDNVVTIELKAATAYTIAKADSESVKLYYVDVKDNRAGNTFKAYKDNLDPYFTISDYEPGNDGKPIDLTGATQKGRFKVHSANDAGLEGTIKFTVFEGCSATLEFWAASAMGGTDGKIGLYKVGKDEPEETFTVIKSNDYGTGSGKKSVPRTTATTTLKGGETYYLAQVPDTEAPNGASVYYIIVTEKLPKLGFATEPKFTSTGNPDSPYIGDVLTLEYSANEDETRTPTIVWSSVEEKEDGTIATDTLEADANSDGKKYTVKDTDKGKKIQATVTFEAADDMAEVTADCITEDAVTEWTFGFKANPVLTSDNEDPDVLNPDDVLTLTYELNKEGTDVSDIKWERVTTAEDGTETKVDLTADEESENKEYTVVAEDVGSIIRVTVTPKLDDGTVGTSRSAESVVVEEVELDELEFTKAPTLDISAGGSLTAPKVGDVLTLSYALSIEGEDKSEIKWERITTAEDGTETPADLTADTGSEGKKYTVVAADVGSIIRVTVTPKLAEGNTGEADYDETGEVIGTALDVVTFKTEPSLTISAGGSLTTPHPTDVLTVTYELDIDIAAGDEDASTYEWYRVSATAADAAPAPIVGETGKSYTIKATDVGYKIGVKVTPDSKDKEAGEAKEAALSVAVTKKDSNLDSSKATIWVVGDSTVSGFKDNYYIPRQGYGEQIGNYFNADVYNLAHSGASSKDFITMSEYTALMNGAKDAEGNVVTPKLGDAQTQDKFLIIGFGHNDEKNEDARYTNPNGDYKTEGSFAKSLYDNYIKKALDAGVTPVVVTPIVRYAEANTVESYTNTAKAHVTSTVGNYPGGDYPKAIREMCETLNSQGENVILVDLTKATIEKNVAMGDKAQYMHAFTGAKWTDDTKTEKEAVGRDDTHTNSFGAKMNAWLIAELTKGTVLNAYRKEGITEPTYDTDYAETINANYEIVDYSSPDDGAVTKSGWPVYTDANGNAWYGTVFGDAGGQTKITKVNEDGTNGEIITDYFNAVIGDDNSLTLSVTGNAGKFASGTEGFIFYYTKVKAGSNFTLSAKAKVNSFEPNNQVSYGLMARDDLYINTHIGSKMGDFVAAGTLNQGKYNCFGRKSGDRYFGPEAATGYITAGDTLDLKIVGTSDGFTMNYGANDPVSAGFDYPLTSVDANYIYVGLYVARNANITFSDISLVTDGAVYPEENPAPAPGPEDTVAAPTAEPVDGTEVAVDSKITLKSATEGAVIHYTTDRTVPTASSATYADGITVTSEMVKDNAVTVKAIAVKDGMKDSDVATFVYTVTPEGTVSIPTATPTTGSSVKDGDKITLKSNTEGAAIYYTTDGTEPSASSTPYTDGITVTKEMAKDNVVTLKAIAVKDGMTSSAVVTYEYTYTTSTEPPVAETIAAPTAAPATGSKVKNGDSITLKSATDGAAIYYMTDGTTPTATTGNLYSNPITVNKSMIKDKKVTIKAIAVKEGTSSTVAEFVYDVLVEPGLKVYFANDEEIYSTYTGSAITPEIIVENNGEELELGVDYTVKYTNNVKASKESESAEGYLVAEKKRPKITVTGKNNLVGKEDVYFDIVAKDINDEDVIKGSVIVATNSKATPILLYNNTKLNVKKDFEITEPAANTKWTESGTMTIKGKGNFAGEYVLNVTVKDRNDLNTFTVTLDSKANKALTYNGEDQYPVFKVVDKAHKVEFDPKDENSDFDNNFYVMYPGDKTSAGSKKFTVVGISEKYTGSVTKTYTVAPDKTGSNITVDASAVENKEYPYVSTGATIDEEDITVTYNTTAATTTLRNGVDYKISYSSNKKVGQAKYTITYLGNYKGSPAYKGNFTITTAKLTDENNDVKAVAMDKVYKKKGIYKSAPYVTIDGALLKASNYTVKYYTDEAMQNEMSKSNMIELAEGETSKTVYVKITGKGNYAPDSSDEAGYVYTTFNVCSKPDTAYDLSKAKITVVDESRNKLKKLEYDGTELMPDVKIEVKDGKTFRELSEDEYALLNDNITYVNNIYKGKATIVVNGDGTKFVGSKTATFTIAAKNVKGNINK